MDTKFKLENGVEFSPSQRCLIASDGTILELTENSLRFLSLLLDGVTEKEKLIHQVWKEQSGAISESSYYGQLYTLRKAFSQVGLRETLIRTIPRKGAQYVGKVTKVVAAEERAKIVQTAQSERPAVVFPLNGAASVVERMPHENFRFGEREQSKEPARGRFFTQSRWNTFVSILAVVAVCWLSILSVLIIYIFLEHSGLN
ncbi:membrane protein [Leminorella grimontii]|uniref:Membrane protein n=1 Tax=Leminorella grimontii TaxID=82981 RepID=A0AAV5N865_9GAMM|nr:hypothetical protein [Leminorella grimontii]KFC94794.1 hypothetical protein GLGR_2555 [Leminorella grimontii ATCC 33999 = DSM 5078]GKX56537.1 membrane protein [Leminorella grimontii]GKX59863.1 membrane protein [Leminorella grimontii]VFS61583.1 Uncharacterised protein [Leminorella grimontii]